MTERSPDDPTRRTLVPTSSDVARLAGVSRPTVSQILNGRGARFAPETRERVLAAAGTLNYEPSFAAQTLARGRSAVIVMLLPPTTFGLQLQSIVEGVTDVLEEQGLLLVTRYAGGDASSFKRLMAALRPAAVIPLGPIDPSTQEVLDAHGTPVVRPERNRPGSAPETTIGELQATHLHSRGHRSLAFADLRDLRQNVYGQSRMRSFAGTARDLGLREPEVVAVPISATAAVAWVSGLTLPTAVACYNDDVALTLLAAARHLGLVVPDQFAVIGVDDIPLAGAMMPRLTTISYDARAIGEFFARRTLAVLGLVEDRHPGTVAFTLVEGGTT